MRAGRYVVIALGFLLHGYSHLIASNGDLFIGLFFWALIPYAVAAVFGCFRTFAAAALGFALGALAGDIYAFHAVFISPKGSMAGYALLIMPLFNMLICGPIGAVVVWLCARLVGKRSEEETA